MNPFSVSFHLRLSYYIYIATGVPLPVQDMRKMAGHHILLVLVPFAGKIFIVSLIVGVLFTGHSDSGPLEYLLIMRIVFEWLTGLSVVSMILRRENLNKVFMLAAVTERNVAKCGRQRKINYYVAATIGAISLVVSAFDCQSNIPFIINTMETLLISDPIYGCIAFVLLVPSQFSSLVFHYHLILIFTIVQDCVYRMSDNPFTELKFQGLNTVLPIVEGDSPIYCTARSGPGGPPCTHRCSPWYCRIHRLRTISRTYFGTKDLFYLTNQFYFLPMTLVLVGDALNMPIIFVSERFDMYRYLDTTLNDSDRILIILWISMLAMPILINEWIRYKNGYLKTKFCKEVFTIEEVQLKKMLAKFTMSASNEFHNSPWRLFALDFSLLSVILDTVILLGTTFVIPSN
ncbi:hypothetical protein J6590_007319 [Homalodisca vitripennis]|nr:hypothetical protein J6590_007319 [Homalodisca vitripennis]